MLPKWANLHMIYMLPGSHQRKVMLLNTLLPPALAFLVATAGSAKTFQKRNVSSGAAVQTEVPSGLCDICSALAVCPVSSPTCTQLHGSAACNTIMRHIAHEIFFRSTKWTEDALNG